MSDLRPPSIVADPAHPRREWGPHASAGTALAAGLSVASLIAAAGLLPLVIAVEAVPDRVLAFMVAAGFLMAAVIGLGGGVRCRTLRYVLGPTGLEVRAPGLRFRMRYDQIERVGSLDGPVASTRPTLWPGAHFGCERLGHRRVDWYSTTSAADHSVVVEGGNDVCVLTPDDAAAFRESLVRLASTTELGATAPARVDCGWLEQLGRIDGWSRVLALGCLAALATMLWLNVGPSGPARPGTLAAASWVGVDLLLAAALLRWGPLYGRFLLLAGISACLVAMAI